MSTTVVDFETSCDLFQTPDSLASLGVAENLVVDLFIKHLFQAGTGTLGGLAQSLKLPVGLVENIFHRLKTEKLIEVKGMYGEDYHFSLSLAGKTMATDRMSVSRYTGPVPVP